MIPDSQFAELKRYLDREATRINDVRFIANDPVQFPRRFERLPDIEIAALLSATIAWGNRTMICNNCNKMLQLMDNAPLEFVTDGAFELLPDQLNIHRTFFGRNLKHMLRGLRTIYHKYGSTLLPPLTTWPTTKLRRGDSWNLSTAYSPMQTTAWATADACRSTCAQQH